MEKKTLKLSGQMRVIQLDTEGKAEVNEFAATLNELANRLEHVRTSSNLPQYLQSELTEIKVELRKLANNND